MGMNVSSSLIGQTSLPTSPSIQVIANPAAGADWQFQNNALGAVTMRLYQVYAKLVTATTVLAPAREVHLQTFVPAGPPVTMWRFPVPNDQGDATTIEYLWSMGTGTFVLGASHAVLGLPYNVDLPVNTFIASFTDGLQPTDQWSNITLLWAPFSRFPI